MTRSICMVLIVLSSGLIACGTSPVADHYYSLVLAADDVSAGNGNLESGSSLVLAPVELAPFLNQYNLVIQTGATEVESANHHFWAEPLDKAIAKILARDLNDLSDNLSVVTDAGIWTPDPQCNLRVEFDGFHATINSGVVAGGQFWLRGSEKNGVYAFEFSRTLDGDGYAQAVDVMRELLRDVAEMVAQSIEVGGYCAADGE